VEAILRTLPGTRGVERLHSTDDYPAYLVLGQSDHIMPGSDTATANAAYSASDLCPAIYELAREHDWPLRELRRDVRTLETVFNELATAA
jgi:hypothetical protein